MPKAQSAVERIQAIEKAIEAARVGKDDTERDLNKVNREIVDILSRIDPDREALAKAEGKRSRLEHDSDTLQARIGALTGSLPEARLSVDEERLQTALRKRPTVAKRLEAAVSTWREGSRGVHLLAAAAKDLRETRWELQETDDHIRYLETLLDAPKRAELVVIDLPDEKEVENMRELVGQGVRLNRFPPLSFKKTSWARELEQLRNERSRAAARELNESQYQRQQAGGL